MACFKPTHITGETTAHTELDVGPMRLQLRLANATFAKDCSYFIAVQYGEGDAVQKFRTEVSESTSTPVFGRSAFDIALPAAALQDGAAQHGQFVQQKPPKAQAPLGPESYGGTLLAATGGVRGVRRGCAHRAAEILFFATDSGRLTDCRGGAALGREHGIRMSQVLYKMGLARLTKCVRRARTRAQIKS